MNAQNRTESRANEVERLQRALDASLAKIADLQATVEKADKAIADKDTALKDAYTVIGSKTKELEIANEALSKTGTTIEKLGETVGKQSDTIIKQSDTIIKQADKNAKAEIDLENAKKSASRWKVLGGVMSVVATVLILK